MLRRNGRRIHIRPKVYRVLNYLLENRNHVVSKDELCETVWNGRCISNTAIESTVMAARRATGDSGKTQRIIQTLPCHGYHFVMPINCTLSD